MLKVHRVQYYCNHLPSRQSTLVLLRNTYCSTTNPPSTPNVLEILEAMRSTKSMQRTQLIRNQKRSKLMRYVPNTVYLSVLGTGARGAPSALYLYTNQRKYLFNCGEGSQRLANEHRMKLTSLDQIFLTQMTWRNIGGLPGTALTLQDVGVSEMTLHGPPGLEELFAATKRFIVLNHMEIKTPKCEAGSTYEDNVLKLQYVPLMAEGLTSSEPILDFPIAEDTTDYYAHEFRRQVEAPVPLPNVQVSIELKHQKQKQIAMSYICQLTSQRGTLNLDACVDRGVPPGPLLGQLKNGIDVTLPNGNVVIANDVRTPDDPGSIFIVVDCPSENHLTSLTQNEYFAKHQNNPTDPYDVPVLVVHFTSTQIANHPDYQKWMMAFGPKTQHLFINEDNTCTGTVGVHRYQYHLNMLHPRLFPPLSMHGIQVEERDVTESEVSQMMSKSKKYRNFEEMYATERQDFPADERHKLFCSTLYRYYLRPRLGGDTQAQVKMNPKEYYCQTRLIPSFDDVCAELHQKLDEHYKNISEPLDAQRFCTFLGTGSSIPNKTRNTSAIVVRTAHDKLFLLDCGEGTILQMIRFWGPANIDRKLTQLKGIYISHLHADHHIGLIGVLQARRAAFERLKLEPEPVILFAPGQIEWWLNFYNHYYEPLADQYDLVSNYMLMSLMKTQSSSSTDSCDIKKIQRVGLKDITTCYVRHCPYSYGVCFVTELGNYRVTYSGDTVPTKKLVQLGQNSDLLIHEATMEDALYMEAHTKMHSTTSEAIKVGEEMQAKFTILTHFSQRYAKLPLFNANFTDRVGVAFDNMQFNMEDLPTLPMLQEPLNLLFCDFVEIMRDNNMKRKFRNDRLDQYEKSLVEKVKGAN